MPPPAEGRWGTAHPVLVAASAPDRRWLALCEARRDDDGNGAIRVVVGEQGEIEGDRLAGYFVSQSGEGESIESFAGSDPTGRYVALVTGGRLLLRDTHRGGDVDLGARGADVRDDRSSFRHHRAVAFSPAGSRMLYLRRQNGRTDVVIRALEGGNEVSLDPGDGELWRADFDASGRFIVLSVVSQDTNHNGRLDWTIPEAAEPEMRCTAPVPRYRVWERSGDRPEIRIASADGGAVHAAPDLVATLGGSWVTREPDRSLMLRTAAGHAVLLARKECEARVLHADPERQLLIVTCRQKNGRAGVRIVGPHLRQELALEMSLYGGDHSYPGSPRYVPLYPGQDTVLVDLQERKVSKLVPGDRVLATEGARALVLRNNRLVFHKVGGEERTLAGSVDDFARLRRAGSVVALEPLVVDLTRGELVGIAARHPLAVSTDGRVLVAEGAAGSDRTLPLGPLVWVRPEPASDAKPQ